MLTYTYVDNSNVFIEGQRLSAVKKRMARDLKDAIDNRIVDHGWQPDYGRLHALVCGDHSEIGVANLWGSPPPYDSFWRMVESKGFKVTTYDKSPNGTEKKVDVAIAYQMTRMRSRSSTERRARSRWSLGTRTSSRSSRISRRRASGSASRSGRTRRVN